MVWDMQELDRSDIPYLGWYLAGRRGPAMSLPSYLWYANQQDGAGHFEVVTHVGAEFSDRRERFVRAQDVGLSLVKGMIFLDRWAQDQRYEVDLPIPSDQLVDASSIRNAIMRGLLRLRNDGHRNGNYQLDVRGIAFTLAVPEHQVTTALEHLRERGLIDGVGTSSSSVGTGMLWLTANGAEQAEQLDESTSLHHGEDVVRVILFTDIVGSTSLTEEIGDDAFRRRADALDAGVRAAVRRARGAPIEGKRLGDGLLAVFTSGRAAIDAAIACRQVAREQGMGLHVGLHAGDVTYQGTDIAGGAVNIAARICEQSSPNEILISDVVRGLVRTSSRATFGDARVLSLKGIEGEQRVFSLTD